MEKLKVKVDNIQKKNKYWNGLNCAERNTCDNEMKFDCSNCEYGFNERDYNTNALRELLSEIGIESVDDLWSE